VVLIGLVFEREIIICMSLGLRRLEILKGWLLKGLLLEVVLM